MNNYISEWRICVRETAYSQLIASILGIIALAPLALMNVKGITTDSVHPRTMYVVPAIAIFVPVLSGYLWSSVQLIKATQLGREINDALKLCQSCQIITGVCNIVMDVLVFGLWYMIVTYPSHGEEKSMSMVKGCVVAIVMVSSEICYHYIVYRFMRELDNNRQCDQQAPTALEAYLGAYPQVSVKFECEICSTNKKV